MARQSRGFGSVTRTANNKWLAKVPVGKTAKGETRYRSKTFLTKTEANNWRKSAIALREQRKLIPGSRESFMRYATDLLLSSSDRVSERTLNGYYRNLKKHVFPVLGGKSLDAINSRETELLLKNLRKHRSAATLHRKYLTCN